METNNKYYKIDSILSKGADYNIIFGERSNGKTYAALEYGLCEYVRTGKQFAYIRRWREDLRGKRGETLFANHVANGFISTLTGGVYDDVVYTGGKWYLAKYDAKQKRRVSADTPFCYGFCLSEQEHEKSTSYPNITTVVFDEFLSRRFYLADEFMLFMNLLSTIIRQRDDVRVIMLGNTVNKFCPYFTDMGLTHVTEMKQGTIDIYKFGEKGAVVAVEYCSSMEHSKASNKYFCFDNEKLQMITGGKWELAVYPHLPKKYKPADVLYVYYIVYGDNVLQANIIQSDDDIFTFIHAKTTPIKDDGESLVYSLESSSRPNYRRKLISSVGGIESKISAFFAMDKVFYQSNEIGEIVRNYIQASMRSNVLQK